MAIGDTVTAGIHGPVDQAEALTGPVCGQVIRIPCSSPVAGQWQMGNTGATPSSQQTGAVGSTVITSDTALDCTFGLNPTTGPNRQLQDRRAVIVVTRTNVIGSGGVLRSLVLNTNQLFITP